MKKYLLCCTFFLMIISCSDSGTNLLMQDRINIYAVAVPYLSENTNITIYEQVDGYAFSELRFVVYNIEIYRCWLELQPGHEYTGSKSVPTTYVTIYFPEDLYAIDSEGSNLEFVKTMDHTLEYHIYSPDTISNVDWFIKKVDLLEVTTSNGTETYNVYKNLNFIEFSNSIKVDTLYGCNGGDMLFQLYYSSNIVGTTNFQVNFRNSICALSNYEWQGGIEDYYAIYRALEDKYYPTSGTVHLTIEGWTN